MRVDKLHLQDFGQFHNKDITLAPGINVVYGANEAGKSTIKDFIVDMLYGIDKARGLGARFDHYEQKKPINGSAFSGAMEVSVQGTDYLIERNFARQEKKTTVRDMDTAREIMLSEENNLVGTLLNTDKSTYLNTLCISQMEVSTDKEIADKLNNYIVNMASSRNGDIDAVSAIMELKNKKKAFSNKELEQKEQELTARLSLDRDFDAELAAVKEEYAKVEAEMEGKEPAKLQFTPIKNPAAEETAEEDAGLEEAEDLSEPMTKRERDINMLRNMGKKSVLDNVFVILFIALIFIALFVGAAYLVPLNIPEIKMGIMGFGIILVAITTVQVLARRAKLYKLLEELEIEQGFEEAKAESADMGTQRELVNRLSNLKLKEQNILKERAGQEQTLSELTKLKEQMQANDVETAAIDLAMKTIQDLSEEIYDSFGSVLNEQVSEIISRITNNKYSEVKIDDQLRVMVKSGSSFISMDYLSTGTMEQIYLALRLSIANVLIAEEMPIIMDDVFVTYDYQRLKETLSCLGEYRNRQIIIFTTNPGIQDMFAGLGIESNYIAI
jgi:uncharacterized protein YhaN